MLILGILLFGMIVGAAAQLILHRGSGINWPMAFATGIIGSFIGGLLVSLINHDGFELRMSGILGSIVGAVIATLAWEWLQGRRGTAA
jgi:uncharacterized membrane protein YeaQ/YmgE (transglycosylase-associated protein family)